ncbi:MAG: CARDB domain-containing protein, partial [Thermoplasmatota archaeon]
AQQRVFSPTGIAPIKANPAIDGDHAFVASFQGDIYMFGPPVPPRPDLVPTLHFTNATGALKVTVTNQGNGSAAASTLRLLVDGTLLADFATPALAPGASATFNQTLTLGIGAHPVRALADQANAVPESNESNNEADMTIHVNPPPTTPAPVATTQPGSGGPSTSKGKAPAVGPVVIGLTLLALAVVARRRR